MFPNEKLIQRKRWLANNDTDKQPRKKIKLIIYMKGKLYIPRHLPGRGKKNVNFNVE